MKAKHFHILAFFEQLMLDGKAIVFALIGLLAFFHLAWWQWGLSVILWLAFEIADFAKQKYWLTEHELVLTSGIIHKHWRHLPYQKIQNIHRSQWFFLKPFRLEKIAVDSAGHGGERANQIKLPVIPSWLTWVLEKKHQQPKWPLDQLLEVVEKAQREKRYDYDQVMKELAHTTLVFSDYEPAQPDEKDGVDSYQSSVSSLFLYAVTAPEILLQFAVAFGFLFRVDHHGELFSKIFSEMTAFGLLIAIGIVAAFLVVLFIFNIIKTILLYYGFTLKNEGRYLQIHRGFFETRSLSLAKSRIQSLQIEQNLWRRFLKMATVRLRIITDKNGDDEVAKRLPTLLPLIKEKRVAKTVNSFLPDLLPKERVVIRSKGYYQSLIMARNASCLLLIPLAVLLYFVDNPFSFLFVLLVLLVAFAAGFYKGRVTGVTQVLDGQVLVLQTARFFTKKTNYIPIKAIQSLSLRQSLWLSIRNKRAHVTVLVRSDNGISAIETRYLPLHEAHMIYQSYQDGYRK
ncbi:PH domain-containing protein [Fructobacillus sp. M1-13]|uniref:PH domain-containing protein n=1 Tax=Fructobacillus papyriferae TaxID=2713171 RepID=A0ABS5QNH0_9LACO|nr:PH domain-containing protein [Fructobacillus papyriferae]MBS9334658.1 PH domain-containing protein [Fructobacillus papyriferae]MCD2158648.1 PH domain-containing protein [Fructobacillus papyriferae]